MALAIKVKYRQFKAGTHNGNVDDVGSGDKDKCKSDHYSGPHVRPKADPEPVNLLYLSMGCVVIKQTKKKTDFLCYQIIQSNTIWPLPR